MSGMTVEERGDLAERLLPVAANLVTLVHGDGGPQDVHGVLATLDSHEKDALLVVLAGLVDPEQPLGKALGWLEFTEDRDLAVPPWTDGRAVRELAPEPVVEAEAIDPVAVRRYVQGSGVEVSEPERLAAVRELAAAGMSYTDIDSLRALEGGDTGKFVNRMKKRHERSGRPFPAIHAHSKPDAFTPVQARQLRERYASEDVTDLELAMSWGVTRKTMTALLSGETYRTAGGPIREKRTKASAASKQGFIGHPNAGRPDGFAAVPYNQIRF
ncbi:hypothetical protein ACFQ0X_43975 [Streptomyces rectiviolaceus]|uniref:Uncharacterized protein n=1 Tax=Streptomyces rectiviolaceus TaxID=332591 RepID=A0ABP6NQL4_9ACTN